MTVPLEQKTKFFYKRAGITCYGSWETVLPTVPHCPQASSQVVHLLDLEENEKHSFHKLHKIIRDTPGQSLDFARKLCTSATCYYDKQTGIVALKLCLLPGSYTYQYILTIISENPCNFATA